MINLQHILPGHSLAQCCYPWAAIVILSHLKHDYHSFIHVYPRELIIPSPGPGPSTFTQSHYQSHSISEAMDSDLLCSQCISLCLLNYNKGITSCRAGNQTICQQEKQMDYDNQLVDLVELSNRNTVCSVLLLAQFSIHLNRGVSLEIYNYYFYRCYELGKLKNGFYFEVFFRQI